MLLTKTSFNNSVLYSPTVPVASGDMAVDLVLKLEHQMSNLDRCLGLAAPQIGFPFSVAIIRHGGVAINLINPSIVSVDNPFIHRGEGCMSIPGQKYNVPRFKTIRIKNHLLTESLQGTFEMKSGLAGGINNAPFAGKDIPKNLFLVPVEQVFVYENYESDWGGIICIGIQHETDHLSGVTIDRVEGSSLDLSSLSGKDKVGRNDPCHCGSGKKAKKCCLA